MSTPVVLDIHRSALRNSLLALEKEVTTDRGWWLRHSKLRQQLPNEALLELHRNVEHHLHRGSGAVVIRLGHDAPPDSVRLLQLAVGEDFGAIVTIAPDEPGRPLFTISATEGRGKTGAYRGNAKKREAIGFHTDGSGRSERVAILGMSCIRPARQGGESRLSDSRAVRPLLSSTALSVLETPLPREDPYQELPADRLVIAPIFDTEHDNIFSYHPARVRNGIRLTRGALTRSEAEALTELDQRLEDVSTQLLLEAGDILMIDNERIAHDRRPFVDDPAQPRLLERLWIAPTPISLVRPNSLSRQESARKAQP